MPGELKQYFEINKVDEEARMVWGYASTTSVDAQGETVTKAALEAAWDDYMQFANVREMHQSWAAGVVKEYEFREDGVFIGAHIVDDGAWAKVKAGVYKGFSIGGKKLPGGYDPLTKTISSMKLTEISLVDRPANPGSLIEMYKADTLENDMDEAQLKELQDLLTKGEITPGALLELVRDSVAKRNSQPVEGQQDPTIAQNTEGQQAPQGDVTKVDTPPAAAAQATEPVKVAIQKAFGALGDKDAIQKGLYDVGRLAELVQSLSWLQSGCTYEAETEGDNSPLPAKLAAAVAALGQVLVEMATEEVSELVAALKLPEGTAPLEMMNAVVANAMPSEPIQKVDGGTAQEPQDDTVLKGLVGMTAAHDEELKKVLASVASTSSAMEDLRKSVEASNKELTELRKRFDAMPSRPKAALHAVNKSDDGDPLLSQPGQVEPVLKADGSVDQAATEIKKIYASGGRFL